MINYIQSLLLKVEKQYKIILKNKILIKKKTPINKIIVPISTPNKLIIYKDLTIS